MGDDKLTRWDLEPTQVMKGFMVIEATESPDGKWVTYDEAATLITSLREALEPFAEAIQPCDDCMGKWKFGKRPETDDYIRARTALNPSRKETGI